METGSCSSVHGAFGLVGNSERLARARNTIVSGDKSRSKQPGRTDRRWGQRGPPVSREADDPSKPPWTGDHTGRAIGVQTRWIVCDQTESGSVRNRGWTGRVCEGATVCQWGPGTLLWLRVGGQDSGTGNQAGHFNHLYSTCHPMEFKFCNLILSLNSHG